MSKKKVEKQPLVAYFCMEYGLDSEFKQYSGGLGILAGDILKAAKDQSKNMVAVGILWRQGYCRQLIDKSTGKVCDYFSENEPSSLTDTGKTVSVTVRGRQIKCKIWLCDCYGNVPLYLLDANLPSNSDALITGQLYGWFSEERVAQEIILGVGGLKALRALGFKPDVYHFNEGHAVLAGLEMIKLRMDKGESFESAWEKVRRKVVFTTHTPVLAGNESHDHALLQYMGGNCSLNHSHMLRIGGDPFNMTVAGLRLSRMTNAVSELHALTARKMWADVTGASPIIGITNGVHNGTWQDKAVAKAKSEKEMWESHQKNKQELLDEIKVRTGQQLNIDILTIGFARRAAGYKRSDLIFSDIERLEQMFKRGMQLVFSGKAHPNDLAGKEMVETLFKYSIKYPENVVFLQDYDMNIGRMMTRGADVWLNNPIRPQEASGTSGMKAAMNGVLNLSVLDGWWPEGCRHGINGWQFGDGYEGKNHRITDSSALYSLLEQTIIPLYYEDNETWLKMMKSSISMATNRFSAKTMVDNYYEKLYNVTIQPYKN